VAAMAEVFLGRGGDVLERITHQSFDVSPFIQLYSFLSRSFILLCLDGGDREAGDEGLLNIADQ
jgi:hypothetical protein